MVTVTTSGVEILKPGSGGTRISSTVALKRVTLVCASTVAKRPFQLFGNAAAAFRPLRPSSTPRLMATRTGSPSELSNAVTNPLPS